MICFTESLISQTPATGDLVYGESLLSNKLMYKWQKKLLSESPLDATMAITTGSQHLPSLYICPRPWCYLPTLRERSWTPAGGGRMGGRGGGCCRRRSSDGAYNKSLINRVLLQFRPIAPKPAGNNSVTGGKTPERQNIVVNDRRVKRRSNDKGLLERRSSECTIDRKPPNLMESSDLLVLDKEKTASFSFYVTPVVQRKKVAVETLVMMECITETISINGVGLELGLISDMDRVKKLEVDKNPGFVSDVWNRVQWVNEAYKMMVSQEENEVSSPQTPQELKVWLVMKQDQHHLPYYLYPAAFSCRVKLRYTWHDQRRSSTVPCDVWRMDFGGFAWKLDLQAALSLGLSTEIKL
ncbi:unnamed protein product [Ilex paraguariensis]|uniref:DUF7950 domain-containing protein n=1 Tax=Ilex paraguariensis TaxID=185542 RepID=A0ABC8R1D5_9AQUA